LTALTVRAPNCGTILQPSEMVSQSNLSEWFIHTSNRRYVSVPIGSTLDRSKVPRRDLRPERFILYDKVLGFSVPLLHGAYAHRYSLLRDVELSSNLGLSLALSQEFEDFSFLFAYVCFEHESEREGSLYFYPSFETFTN
jgi:hypothetical protein